MLQSAVGITTTDNNMYLYSLIKMWREEQRSLDIVHDTVIIA